jgi:RHS repeat-associated protein
VGLSTAAGSASPAGYTAAGDLANAQYGYSPKAATTALTLSRAYDTRNRVTQEQALSGSNPVYSFTMPSGYDGVGNPKGVNDSVGLDWTFGYDYLNRLTSATGGTNFAGQGLTWTYDNFGNRLTQAVTGSALAQYAASATYGTNNQTTSTNLGAVKYDEAGDILSDGVNSYAIDAESRVCSYHTSILNENWTNVYDAGGHRVAKGQVPSGSSCYTGTGFVPSETDVLGQNGEQFSTLTPSGWQSTNVYANGQLLATYEGSGVYFALNDWLGTKRVVTDGTGKTVDTYKSLWYGDALSPSSGGPSDHHFTGKLRDPQSGLDYFGARYYASNMGRFMSPDWNDDPVPVPYADLTNPQSLNLYAYVNNNPLSGTDPRGHSDPQSPWDNSGSESNESLDQFFAASMNGGTRQTGGAALLAQQQNNATALPTGTQLTMVQTLMGEQTGEASVGTNQYGDDQSGRKAGLPTGAKITDATLDKEANLMAGTMLNLGHIGNAKTYLGLPAGKHLTALAAKARPGSALAIQLQRDIGAVKNATPSAYSQWRAVNQGFIRSRGDALRVAGTDFIP